VIGVWPVEGLPEVRPGDDLGALIAGAGEAVGFEGGDVVVVAHKAVSKSEGRLASGDRLRTALGEARRVLRRAGDMIIAETRHGFVCANSGVDASNVGSDRLALLPLDPDLSARRIRARLEHLTGVRLGVVVSDTFGRAWRVGQTNVAIGVAGIEPFIDYRGQRDASGRELSATLICVADEIAGAAELVMGKVTGVCAAIVRGAPVRFGRGAATEIVRAPADDLFR
jgi:coenzyme F420-0:L-glutamate ligase/coenzyme F420-1:gamma-L-glutamate ligase